MQILLPCIPQMDTTLCLFARAFDLRRHLFNVNAFHDRSSLVRAVDLWVR